MGIFFSHESSRRGDRFFTKKVVNSAVSIKNGIVNSLQLGDLNVQKDFGYAPDFVEAAYLMLQANEPNDYVIGTGELTCLGDFVQKCFKQLNLDCQRFVISNTKLNKRDTNTLKADISKITNDLGWRPRHSVDDLVFEMLVDCMEKA